MKIINVMAVSLDGKIASTNLESDAQRRALGFTNNDDREHVRAQILEADAIITGANSMRASGGAWNQKNAKGVYPRWYVLSRKGLEKDLAFWRQTSIPRTVVIPETHLQAPLPDPSVQILVTAGEDPALAVQRDLKAQGANTVLLFGGGAINQLFYNAGLVNELKITVCPMIIGRSGAPEFMMGSLDKSVRLQLLHSKVIETHVFLTYRVY